MTLDANEVALNKYLAEQDKLDAFDDARDAKAAELAAEATDDFSDEAQDALTEEEVWPLLKKMSLFCSDDFYNQGEGHKQAFTAACVEFMYKWREATAAMLQEEAEQELINESQDPS